MQQIINFLLRNKTFLLYLLLLFISLFLTVQSHSYHKSKFVHSANFLSGGLYESFHNISEYFDLKHENEILAEENTRLRNSLFNLENKTEEIDSTIGSKHYRFTPAQVIKNSYSSTNNYLLVNKGKKDSIQQDFGVVSPTGLVGIVDKTALNHARVISILNTNSRINAQLKTTNHYGTLRWNGVSPEFVQLVDVPRTAPVHEGDTIITGGRSIIFPKGIAIGRVVSYKLDPTEDFYEIKVKLFNDMTNIGHVYIIENLDAAEILELENTDE